MKKQAYITYQLSFDDVKNAIQRYLEYNNEFVTVTDIVPINSRGLGICGQQDINNGLKVTAVNKTVTMSE